MAGSYKHATNDDGSLRDNESFVQMVENLGDAYETVEEMYGMIWYLADLANESSDKTKIAILVEEARQYYKEGVIISPTDRQAMY